MGFKEPPLQGVLCVFMLLMVTLPINFIQLLTCATLPRAVARKISAELYRLCGYVLFLFAEKWATVELVFYGDKIPQGESALVISNHLGAEFVHLFQLACASLALSPLPLISSYNSEKSSCGAGTART